MSNYGVVNDDDNGRYVAQVTWEGEKKGLLWFSLFILRQLKEMYVCLCKFAFHCLKAIRNPSISASCTHSYKCKEKSELVSSF